MPNLYIIAGCNGAGKTTAAFSLLPDVFQTLEFVNADEIARGLSPLNVEGVAFQAGRIMIERMNQLIVERKSFAFETTLSGLSYLPLLKNAKTHGFKITLFFVYLNTVELAINRVAVRVSKGGHHILKDVIIRRYHKGLTNFKKYASLSDDWYIYDNSALSYQIIAKNISGVAEIINFDIYQKINK